MIDPISRIPLKSPGYCYLMRNEAMKEGILKIGASTCLPEERAKQLTASTSSALPFVVLYSRATNDVNATEAAMHSAFAAQRVNEGREYFRVSLYEAARTLDSLCADTFSRFDPPTPMAELFASFPDDGTGRSLTVEEQIACLQLAAKLA